MGNSSRLLQQPEKYEIRCTSQPLSDYRTIGPITVLSVTGYIDAETFPQLIGEADKVLAAGHVNLIFDLAGVDYISSGGLVALQTVVGRAASRGGKAVLCNIGKQVAQVLKLSGFDQRLNIYADLAAAMASFS